jgi:hypothetical protein
VGGIHSTNYHPLAIVTINKDVIIFLMSKIFFALTSAAVISGAVYFYRFEILNLVKPEPPSSAYVAGSNTFPELVAGMRLEKYFGEPLIMTHSGCMSKDITEECESVAEERKYTPDEWTQYVEMPTLEKRQSKTLLSAYMYGVVTYDLTEGDKKTEQDIMMKNTAPITVAGHEVRYHNKAIFWIPEGEVDMVSISLTPVKFFLGDMQIEVTENDFFKNSDFIEVFLQLFPPLKQ